jgi:2-oxoglutarate ferredoxin oxidoreductase subunit delta
MEAIMIKREHTKTHFVTLETGKCKACWKCIADCHGRVIGKVDLPWHKHALITAPDKCTGCLKCVGVCPNGAFIKADNAKQEGRNRKRHTFVSFMINNLLLAAGLLLALSGMVLQIGFHAGAHERGADVIHSGVVQYEEVRKINPDKIVCGFNYSGWSALHKWAVVFFSLLIIYHIYTHWRWYKGVISKHLIGKNVQVITLSVLFLLAAVTGIIPWLIDLYGGPVGVRIALIEIHDKLTLLLIIYFILHVIKRSKWYAAAYAKLKN